MMSHPDLPTLEDLPKPHYDQLAIVKLYIGEAKQCRVDHSDWILHPKVGHVLAAIRSTL